MGAISFTATLQKGGFLDAGVEGALCDEATKERLRHIGAAYDWPIDPRIP